MTEEPQPARVVLERRGLLSYALAALSYLQVGFGGYLAYRQFDRSLNASDAEYLNPTSILDTGYGQLLFMLIFGATVGLRFWADTRPNRPLIAERAADDHAIRRRRDSKRFNERLKLASSALNTAGTSSLVAGFVVPMINQTGTGMRSYLLGAIAASVCYCGAQLIIGLWKTEE